MYLVEFNNGFESDENTLSQLFENLEEAKQYAKSNCDVYYNIAEGEYEIDEDNIIIGSGKTILSNCDDTSITWFYSWTADFCKVEAL